MGWGGRNHCDTLGERERLSSPALPRGVPVCGAAGGMKMGIKMMRMEIRVRIRMGMMIGIKVRM